MKLSTLNKIISVIATISVILSVFIIYFQVNYLMYGGIRKIVEVDRPVIHRIDKIVEIPKEVIIQKSMPDTVDLQGVIQKIADKYVKGGRPTRFEITNNCPPFTHSVVCFTTMDAPPTGSLSEALKSI